MKGVVKVKDANGFGNELKDMNITYQVMSHLVKFQVDNINQFVQVLDIYGRYEDI